MISKEDVKHLAELARLELTEDEVSKLQADMSSILDYVGQVSAVATEGQQEVPLNHNIMRADTPRPATDTFAGKESNVQAAFPKQENGYNVVRKIIQKDE